MQKYAPLKPEGIQSIFGTEFFSPLSFRENKLLLARKLFLDTGMASPGRVEQEETSVLVEYAFEYTSKDGQLISIKPNERYMLLRKTNDHWWHVRKSKEGRPFYIPAKYVRQLVPLTQTISSPDKLAPTALLENVNSEAPIRAGGEQPPEYEYHFVKAIQEHEVDSSQKQHPVSSGVETMVRSDSSKKTLSSISGATRATFSTLSASHGSLQPPYDAGSNCSLLGGSHSIEPMRPTVSLDDLARLAPQSQVNIENSGLYKAASWGPPRPFLKSTSEPFHKPMEEKVDEGTQEGSPTQVKHVWLQRH